MDRDKLTVIARIILFAAAFILLAVSMLNLVEGSWPLGTCLGCIVAGNLINIQQFKKKQKEYKDKGKI